MSRGLGRWERAIWAIINKTKSKELPSGASYKSSVVIYPWILCTDTLNCYDSNNRWSPKPAKLYIDRWTPPTASELEAARRAMHSFVRKFPRYGLISGKGRAGGLYLYERDDPVGAMRALLLSQADNNAVSQSDADAALRHLKDGRTDPFIIGDWSKHAETPEEKRRARQYRRRRRIAVSDISAAVKTTIEAEGVDTEAIAA